jgi:uncharacterized protein YjeT (DUF2065 family)
VSGAALDSYDVRAWSVASGLVRVVFGVMMLAAPEAALRALGFSEVTPATKTVTRLAGIRDFVLGGVTLAALDDRDRLLSASVANATADAGDAAAFAIALRAGQRDAAIRGLAAALPATVAGVWVVRRLS